MGKISVNKVLLLFGMTYLLVSCSHGKGGQTETHRYSASSPSKIHSGSNALVQSNQLAESSKKPVQQTSDSKKGKWYESKKKPFNLTPKKPWKEPLEMNSSGSTFKIGCYIDPLMEHDNTFWRWLKSACTIFPDICPEIVVINRIGYKVVQCPPHKLVELKDYPDHAPVVPRYPRP